MEAASEVVGEEVVVAAVSEVEADSDVPTVAYNKVPSLHNLFFQTSPMQ